MHISAAYAPPPGAEMQHAQSTIVFADSSGVVIVFTRTGRVFGSLITAFCTDTLIEDGAVASISLGGATDAQGLIVNTNPSDISVNEFWFDATPVSGLVHVDPLQIDWMTDENVTLTIIGGTDIASGTIVFDVWYLPLTSDGALVAP